MKISDDYLPELEILVNWNHKNDICKYIFIF